MTRFLIPLFFLLLPCLVFAQFDKANDLFLEKRYAAAIPIFEAGLKEKDNLLAKSRLAFCYRMLNQTDKAELLYNQVVTHEKSRNDNWLFYGEALMSNGKYEEAKAAFLKYFALEPADSLALQRASACDLVPKIKPYFKGVKVEELPFNSEADDNTPAFWLGGLVFTSDRSSGKMLLKEKSGWTGRDYLKLWFAPFDPEKGVFKDPETFSPKLNELNKNCANASFSGDWKNVFFSRNGNTANRKDEYTMQLYEAGRKNGRWKNPRKLDFCQTELNYMHPAVSPDGNTLFFAANAGGHGGFDIFMAQKNKAGAWGRVKNLGPTVNTSAHEAFPFFHRDGRLFFCSKGHAGFGGFDIFQSKLDSASGQWAAPVNLGRPLNSPLDDLGFCLAANDSVGVFTSGRNGGDDDLYVFWLGENKNLRQVLFPKIEKEDVGEMQDSIKTVAQDSSKNTVQDSLKNTFSGAGNFTNVLENQAVENKPSLETELQNGQAQIGKAYLLPGIRYDSDSTKNLSTDAVPEISALANLLKKHPNLELEIGCHTENRGLPEKNLDVSKARAEAIREILIAGGIAPERLLAKGFGGQFPANGCKNEADCPPEKLLENRRLEVKIIKF